MAKEKTRISKLDTSVVKKKEGFFNNTFENTISINESKARLIYDKHLRRSPSGGKCASFFSLFLSCLIAVLTSSFNDVFGIEQSSYFISALFWLGTIISFGCCVYYFIKWLLDRKKYNVETFINELKNKK